VEADHQIHPPVIQEAVVDLVVATEVITHHLVLVDLPLVHLVEQTTQHLQILVGVMMVQMVIHHPAMVVVAVEVPVLLDKQELQVKVEMVEMV
tara:strand:- start:358 stop:636 length:279 start_codon:yes stop_codon:yes gene_type:complete